MEFNEKLQTLRKQRGLTQEELAEALYVSRTAISKWESGRGYPSIDSLKAIASFFSVTVDGLLSGEELLTVAEADAKQVRHRTRDLVFGLLDCAAAMLLFLPFFGQSTTEGIQSVSLLALGDAAAYVRVLYFLLVIGSGLWGVMTLALQTVVHPVWLQCKGKISLVLSALGVLLFTVSLQPYASTYLFVFLGIKALMLIKWQ